MVVREKIKFHQTLAGFFTQKPLYLDEPACNKPNIRKLVEQPWQQIKAKLWEEVTETLCDIFFLEARVKVKMSDLQQQDYKETLQLIPDPENKGCIEAYFKVFMQQKHILKDHSKLTFQLMYNELQWKKGITKNRIEDSKKVFLSLGRIFVHQYRVPKITKSCLIMTLSGHLYNVNSCSFSPDGKRIISGSGDETIKVWDAETGREIISICHNSPVYTCALSPDNKSIVSGSKYNLQIWEANTGKESITLQGNMRDITTCTFSPDSKRIVAEGFDGIINTRTLKIWDAKTGREINSLIGHTAKVTCCAYSPDGRWIASGSKDYTVKLWDAEKCSEILTFKGSVLVFALAFSPDSKRIVSNDGVQLNLWNPNNGRRITIFRGEHAFNIISCAFSPDGKQIVSGSVDKTLKLWNAVTGKEISTFSGHASAVNSCAFSPDGKRIVSGSKDYTVKLWDAATSTEITNLKVDHDYKITSCAFSPDGRQIVSGGGYEHKEEKTLKIWDADSGREIKTFPAQTHQITSCAFSPDRRRIISGSNIYSPISVNDDLLKIWDADSGMEISTLAGHIEGVTSCAFSPDGRRIISGSLDDTIKIWETITGKEITTLKGHSSWVKSCAYSPDGKWIVSGSMDGTLKLWDADTGREILTFTGHISEVTSCAFSPNGKLVVSGESGWNENGNIKIWDATTKNLINSYTGHIKEEIFRFKSEVICCSFSPDGNLIVSACDHDETIRIWEAVTGKDLITFHCESKLLFCALSPCGTRICCGDKKGNLYLLKIVGFELGLPVVTAVRLFKSIPVSESNYMNQMDWDTEVTALCPYCGMRFPYTTNSNKTGDDNQILSGCPECGMMLKFNPFIVNNLDT